MAFVASLPIIMLSDPPEIVFSGLFLGINVSIRPVLTGVKSPSPYIHTYTWKIAPQNVCKTV